MPRNRQYTVVKLFIFCCLFFQVYRFNENILKLIIQVENTYFEMASKSSENCLIIGDGGTMDIKARQYYLSRFLWLSMEKFHSTVLFLSHAVRPIRYCTKTFLLVSPIDIYHLYLTAFSYFFSLVLSSSSSVAAITNHGICDFLETT